MAKKKVTIGASRPQRRNATAAEESPASRTRVHVSAHSPAPAQAPAGPLTKVRRGRLTDGQRVHEPSEIQTTDGLLDSISKLPPSERKLLLARLSLAESGMAGQERDVDMWSLSVYEALVALSGRGDGVGLGPMVVKRLMGTPAAWAPIETFMASAKLSKLMVTERQSFYQLLAKLLVKHAAEVADRTGAPFSAKLVANCVRNVRSVFDDAFPNYVASGLAHIVAKRLTQPRRPANDMEK